VSDLNKIQTNKTGTLSVAGAS